MSVGPMLEAHELVAALGPAPALDAAEEEARTGPMMAHNLVEHPGSAPHDLVTAGVPAAPLAGLDGAAPLGLEGPANATSHSEAPERAPKRRKWSMDDAKKEETSSQRKWFRRQTLEALKVCSVFQGRLACQ